MLKLSEPACVARVRSMAGGVLACTSLLSCGANDDASATKDRQGIASACDVPPGQVNAPTSVMAVVELLNTMPKPVELSCFVESLKRPLGLQASRSIFSAQPASGTESPRMFLFYDPLIMTVVPEGMGSHLLEFGEQRADGRSLKAEIEFPVEKAIQPTEPFERVMYDDEVTNCSFCHGAEEQDPSIAFTRAFLSRAFRPLDNLHVDLDQLAQGALTCDPALEPERCALLNATFGWGEVLERPFSETMGMFP